MSKFTKVTKIYLTSAQIDENGKQVDYKNIYKVLWELQNQTRQVKNKIIQLCWEDMNWRNEFNQINGKYPEKEDVVNKYGYTGISGYAYNLFKDTNNLNSGNFSTTISITCQAYRNSIKDMLRGDKSIIEYKSNQPLDLHKKSIRIIYDDKSGSYYVELSLLQRNSAIGKKYNINSSSLRFKCETKKNNDGRATLKKCLNGIYQINSSTIVYDKKKKMWRLNLTCSWTQDDAVRKLDKDKILGVDLGIANAIYASVYGQYYRYIIGGGEIEDFRNKIEARKRSMQKQSKCCGNGRVGHGYKTRMKPLEKLNTKISDFRNTWNSVHAIDLIDHAIKGGCGTIQMENLSGITDSKGKDSCPKFLRDWTYYDLQTKIEQKAKEVGIQVVYVNPAYTSQRCSKCGHIDKNNRPNQSTFKCTKCGFEENADFNASQNLGIPNIDKIISKSKTYNFESAKR